MADMYTPEEIQEIFQAYNDAVKAGTPISADLAKSMKDAQMGVKGWTDSTNAAMKKLGTSATDLGKNLYKGSKGAGTFGDALESASSAVGMMILALGPFGLAAKVAAFAVTAFGKAVNVAGKQADALYKTYQDLNRVGATTADGIQGVFVNMQKFGYGIEELDKMVQIVAANSETLAKFSQTAADGTNAYANAMQGLVRDPSIRALGKTTDDINTAGAAYIKLQLAGGRSQKDVGDALAYQTKQYIRDLDQLQRLTGKQAEQLQREQDEAMAESAYNDVMSDLQARATAGDKVAEAEINKIITVMGKLSPEMQKQFQRSIGGDISAQSQLFMSMPSLMRNVMDESVSTSKTISDANRDAANTINIMGKSARLNAEGFNETYGNLRGLREFEVSTRDFDEAAESAKRQALLTDASTKNLTVLEIERMKSRDSLQSFVQLGVHPATRALKNLAEVTAKTTGVLPGKGPGGGPAPLPPTKPTPAGSYQSKVIQAESGGQNIANRSGPGGTATSSAFGIAQITKGTFEGLAKQAGPGNPLYGKTFEDMKADVNLQKQALGQLTDKNRLFLQNAGLSTSDAALYLAHFLGPGGAKRVLSLSNDAPIQQAVDFSQYMANPMLQKMATVGDLKDWADKKMGGGGYQFGGIATGPMSGYRTMLHGTEAVIPLPNGKTIPVEMPGFTASLTDQTNLLGQQLGKLDDLIRVMRNQVDVSNKILQRTS